jgi:hypothetical protein
MPSDQVIRVNYFDRQFLRVQDFTDEQAYHLAMRRRHNLAHHSWGIVEGLEVIQDVQAGGLYVTPGMAVDGYGRELVAPERLPLPLGAFDDRGSDILDVFLVYDRRGGDAVPAGYGGCDEDGDGPFYRWIEAPRVTVEAGDLDPADRRHPPGVPPADQDFGPSRTPPDDPLRQWPVFLGQVTRDRSDPSRPTYTVDLAGRPSVDLVGEYVRAASGRAAVQIGEFSQAVTGGASTEPGAPAATTNRRFAVFVPEAETDETRGQPRLAVDKDGKVDIRGDTTVHGDVTIDGHAVEFLAGPARPPNAPPWRIYHLDTGRQHELRVEMARPDTAAERGRTQVVVGTWAKPADGAGQAAFQKCLTVDANCNVTVHGTLTVEGTLNTKETVQAKLSEEARRLGVISAMSGLTTPQPGPAAVLSSRAVVEAMRTPGVVDALLRAQADPRLIAEALAAEPERARAFAELVRRDYPDLAGQLGIRARQRRAKPEGKGKA